jgi:hypothetical protein
MLGYAAEQRKRRYQFGVGRILFLTRSDPIATWYTSTASAACARMGRCCGATSNQVLHAWRPTFACPRHRVVVLRCERAARTALTPHRCPLPYRL